MDVSQNVDRPEHPSMLLLPRIRDADGNSRSSSEGEMVGAVDPEEGAGRRRPQRA